MSHYCTILVHAPCRCNHNRCIVMQVAKPNGDATKFSIIKKTGLSRPVTMLLRRHCCLKVAGCQSRLGRYGSRPLDVVTAYEL